MAARILRMVPQTAIADRDQPNRKQTGSGGVMTGLEKAEAMACYIAQNYQSSIRIKDIADVVGLHPDYASTLFRQTFGMTLTSLITKHRVADVQRQLLTTEDTVLDIAHKAGFESLSRFNSAFKSVTGVTPREYRKRMRLFPSIK
jgi:AraC-like DNA-binding protein